MSGTNALYLTLSALLKHGDTMISISGEPYDSLQEMIGISGNSNQSLKAYGVNYEQIDLIDNEFDEKSIIERLQQKNVKLVEIQRSRGYSQRLSLTIDKIESIIHKMREVNQEVIIMVDNCYCEFVSDLEPTQVGADIAVGSLIKNLGGGIAPNGAYIVGKKDLVYLCSERLNLPGEAKEVGPSLNMNKSILQGLYMAPSVVSSALKTAVLSSRIMENLGYEVEPKYNEDRADIVQSIIFNDKNLLIRFIQGIQMGSAIDSFVKIEASDMPGYDDQVIMASGSFTQGSSIEFSCDGPIREPYIAYLQGSLTYEYGKLGLIKAIENLMKK